MTACKVFGAGLLVLALALPGFAAPKADSVPPLVEKLKKSKDPKVRAEAAKEIGDIAQVKTAWTKVAIPALIDALEDANAAVRLEATVALSYTKAPVKDVIPGYTKLLKDPDGNVRIAAANNLADIGPAAKEVALPILEEIAKELGALTKEDMMKNQGLIQAITGAVNALKVK